MEQPKVILVRPLVDWNLYCDEERRTIELRKEKEVEIPFRFFKRFVQLKVVVPAGPHYGPVVRMLS